MLNSVPRRVLGAFSALSVCALSTAGVSAGSAVAIGVLMHPNVSDYVQVSTSTTPPTEAQCNSVARRCFTPQETQAAYNMMPLYFGRVTGTGVTIAIVDAFGSDTHTQSL